ncbi:MAG: SGNH/GDSL hydrolase family protein [Victivallales bacterium]|nr:SGNH/GDSL hydrolase family protein [Victivallales bacterium]
MKNESSIIRTNAISNVDFRDFTPEKTEPSKEAVDWTISYAFNTQDTKAPRVLLIGDSICNGYQPELRKLLANKVNVSFWASSFCISNPQYMEMLDVVLNGPKPQLVLLNNGLHTPPDEDFATWKAAYSKVIAFVHAKLPSTPILIVNSTPLKEDSRGYVDGINKATAEVAALESLELLDIHSLCASWDREALWSDKYHFKPEGKVLQAKFLSNAILRNLPASLPHASAQQQSATGPDGPIK